MFTPDQSVASSSTYPVNAGSFISAVAPPQNSTTPDGLVKESSVDVLWIYAWVRVFGFAQGVDIAGTTLGRTLFGNLSDRPVGGTSKRSSSMTSRYLYWSREG
jgi:hypothetical protein